MTHKYIVGCYGLVFDGGNLLMVKQRSGFWASKWILPGGKLEIGESFERCIEREILEETGCEIRAERQLHTVASYSPDTVFDKQVVLIFYLCKYISGEPAKGDGVDAAAWVDGDRFLRLVMNESVPPQVFNAVYSVSSKSSFPEVSLDFIEAESILNA